VRFGGWVRTRGDKPALCAGAVAVKVPAMPECAPPNLDHARPAAARGGWLLALVWLWVGGCDGSGLRGGGGGVDAVEDAVSGADIDDADGADDAADASDLADVPVVVDVADTASTDDVPDPDGGDDTTSSPDSAEPGCTGRADGEACDDGNPCTTNDRCEGGRCVATAPTRCDDGNPCTDDRCEVARGGCVHDANLAACDDGNPCTTNDFCRARVCIGGDFACDDRNPCTRDVCASDGVCTHVADDTLPCDDGSACTAGDFCSNGFCINGTGDGCASDTPCVTATCAEDGLRCERVVDDGAPCDDGNACSDGDTCNGGGCASGPPRDCGWDAGCADFRCDPLVGCLLSRLRPALTACDDGDRCTASSACDADGRCIGQSDVSCDDRNPCTRDSCDAARGCVYTTTPTAACDDANACTINDVCNGSTCRGTQLVCNDGDPCTLDRCDALSGCTSSPVVCDDLNPCTADSCGVGGVCVFAPVSGACNDGRTCTIDDRCEAGACVGTSACDDGDPCTRDVCDAEEGCVFVPFVGACDDGDACTADERCDADGVCGGGRVVPVIDDGIACTIDGCSDSGAHVAEPGLCADGEGCSTIDDCVDATGLVMLDMQALPVVDPEAGEVWAVAVAVVADTPVTLVLDGWRLRLPDGAEAVIAGVDDAPLRLEPGATLWLFEATLPVEAETIAWPDGARVIGTFTGSDTPFPPLPGAAIPGLVSPGGRVVAAPFPIPNPP
jgi:hypothetical protein